MFNCFPTEFPSISIPNFGSYIPKPKDYLPKSVINLSDKINELTSSVLELGVKIHSDLRPMNRSIAVVSKAMQLFQLKLLSTRFGQAIKVLDTAYTVFDLFHLGGAIHYFAIERKGPDLEKTDHLMGAAFGLVALNDVVSFVSGHGLLELSALGISYGKITAFTVTLGHFATVGIAVGFAAWTYKAACDYLKDLEIIEDEVERDKLFPGKDLWQKISTASASANFNTMVWAGSELALFVIPMAFSVPASVQLGSAIVIKALGVRSFLLSN